MIRTFEEFTKTGEISLYKHKELEEEIRIMFLTNDLVCCEYGNVFPISRLDNYTFIRNEKIYKVRGFEEVNDKFKCKDYDTIMPMRSTISSAGYDFFAPFDITLEPNQVLSWQTNIKAYMKKDEFLMIVPRSSTGIKKSTILCNTLAIIDADFYNNPKSDGNIGMFIKNIGSETVMWNKGDGVVQGIFVNFLESDNCNSDNIRNGGIGSTTR